MLSRNHSERSDRITRSKSSSSVRRSASLIHDPPNTETSKQYAVTAANIAFGKAQERISNEQRRSAELGRSNSFASASNHNTTQGSHLVRSNSSAAADVCRQRSILRQHAPSLAESLQSEKEVASTTNQNVPPAREFGTPVAYESTPSSYRRLRKVRSMLTPGRRNLPTHGTTSRFHGPPRPFQTVHRTFDDANATIKLRLRRSMSVLKTNSSNIPNSTMRATTASQPHDAAIKMARDQFQADLEQQQNKGRNSRLLTSKSRPPQKAFRKTLRSSKKSEYSGPIASDNQQFPLKSSPPPRTFTLSIRKTVKRIFGRPSSVDKTIPIQHIEATRPHFRDYVEPRVVNVNSGFFADPQCSRDLGSTFGGSVLNRLGSFHGIDATSLLPDSEDLCENITAQSSRLTSWTDSTVTGSSMRLPLDRKRLSIIQEHGSPHQPSSSAGRHLDESSSRLASESPPNAPPPIPRINPQRLYSALMKRIEASEAAERNLKSQLETTTEETGTEPIIMSTDGKLRPADTIKLVLTNPSSRSVSLGQSNRKKEPLHESNYVADDESVTPPTVPANTIRRRRDSRLHEANSASFFPFSSEEKPETPSPFRKALAASREHSSSTGEDASVIHHVVPDSPCPVSESEYSRTTNGLDPPTVDVVANDPNRPMGTATILTNANRSYARPITGISKLREAKSTSSTEWKSWVNSEVAGIDRRYSRIGDRTDMASFDQAHQRENAQIDEDDIAVTNTKAAVGRFRLRLEEHPSLTNLRAQFPVNELSEVPKNTPQIRGHTPSQDLRGNQNHYTSSAQNDENKMPGEGFKVKRSDYVLKTSQMPHPFRKLQQSTPNESEANKSSTSLQRDLTPTPNDYVLRPASRTLSVNTQDQLKSPEVTKTSAVSNHDDEHLLLPFFRLGFRNGSSPAQDDSSTGAIPPCLTEQQSFASRWGINGKRLVSNFLQNGRRGFRAGSATTAESQAGQADGKNEDGYAAFI